MRSALKHASSWRASTPQADKVRPHQAGNPHQPSGFSMANRAPTRLNKLVVPGNILFALVCTLSLIFYWVAVKNLVTLAFRTYEYSHTIFIPFLSAALILSGRAKIFSSVRHSFYPGIGIVTAGVLIGMLFGANAPTGEQNSAFALMILSLVLIWIGAFILSYGWAAFRTGAFALIFLLLTVPIPDFLLGKVIYLVRYGSAEVVLLLFGIVGMPVFREGFCFILPNVSIEIAKECSGIHSTMALLIVTLLAGHLFLWSMLKRTVLILSAVPIVCVTNGIRIASLTLLSIYVNKGILSGRLHHEGGILFFGLALVLMAGVLYLMGLRRTKSAEAVPSRSLPVAE
jgi:exosortase